MAAALASSLILRRFAFIVCQMGSMFAATLAAGQLRATRPATPPPLAPSPLAPGKARGDNPRP